jgi:phosphoglycerol transferase MdoB-like AlkP superfamily enzyme
VLFVRGGFQLRPIGIITASKYVDTNITPTVLNTPFTLMKSVGKQPLKALHYFNSQQELQKYYTSIHNPDKQQKFKPLNIVVIIMESLSKEHIGILNRDVENYRGFTPFIDSLIPHALVCTHAYANGKTSIKGIPSVVASFPTLMENSFVSSIYSSNKVTSLASLLNTKGYKTAFFHGGHNGTMGFDQFAKIAGFDNYYGKNEYNNNADYDGKWGIFDEPFFQYFTNTLNTFKQPFFATIFSLSAHHPYTIPDKYKNKFRKGKIPIQECIMYSDYALKNFFETAKKQSWYNNTLFVITADHCSEVAMRKKYNTDNGNYAIPIIYYMPSDTCLQGVYKKTTQQIDILPSILDYINLNEKYFSFGQSIFNKNIFNFSVSYLNYNYQFISDNTVIKVNNQGDTYSAKKINSNMPINNIDSLKTFTQAFIQTYNSCMINNCMYVK